MKLNTKKGKIEMDNRRVFNQVQSGTLRNNSGEADAVGQKKKELQPLEKKNVMPRKYLTPISSK